MFSRFREELANAFLFQKGITADFVLGMSIMEKLAIGVSLGFFGLVILYVLLAKTSRLNFVPRVFFRLTLLLGCVSSLAISYFIMSEFLVEKSPAVQRQSSPQPVSQGLNRGANPIEQLQGSRQSTIDKLLEP